ncbi:MAG: hypothetical protein RI996_539 [Candidatus Parcubacteria bacterium]|jgi:tetratricopeptide (TPR) repeat protein
MKYIQHIRNIFSKAALFDTIAKYALGAILLLLPLIFSPISNLTTLSVKYFFLYICAVIASSAYLLARRADKKVSLPSKLSIVSIALLPIVSIVATVFTGRFSQSVIGYGVESSTVLSIILFVTLAFLAFEYSREKKAVTKALQLIALSYVVVLAYQILRFVLPENWLSFGQFTGPFSTLLGKWNDLAIYTGMILIAVFFSIKKISHKKQYIALALSIILLTVLHIVSFILLWPVLIAVLLCIVVADSVHKNKITLLSKGGLTTYRLIGLISALIAIIYVTVLIQSVRLNSVGNILRPNLYNLVYALPNSLGQAPQEAIPSASMTADIFVQEVKHNPVFGTGPNRFSEAWAQYKKTEVSQSPYWNSEFTYGSGYFPTLAVSTGILGLLAILLFIGTLFWNIYKAIFSGTLSKNDNIIVFSTLYLLILSIIYVPSIPLIVYLFLGIGYTYSLGKKTDISLASTKMKLLILAKISAVIILAFFVGYLLAKEYIAAYYYQKAVLAIRIEKNIDTADTFLQKAIQTNPKDIYYRAYSDLAILKAQAIIESQTQSSAEISSQAREAATAQITIAQEYADKAILKYPENYFNYIFAAYIYQYNATQIDKTIELYKKSLELYPNNPNAYIGLAKAVATTNNIKETKEYIQKALTIRPTHTDSLLAAAELTLQDKDTNGALELLARAYTSDTSRVDILFQIASIQFELQNNVQEATQTILFAVNSHPESIDAKYTLAILYAKQEKFKDAANILSEIVKRDEKAKSALEPLISELLQNKDPFTQTEPAV